MLIDVATTTRTVNEPPDAPAPGGVRIAALGEAELDALIKRVEEARDNAFALEPDDLSMLLEALVTLAGLAERLEHDDLTIAKLKKLLGIVRSSEKFRDLAGALGKRSGEAGADGTGGKGSEGRKSPPRPKPPTSPPKPTVCHHRLDHLERGQCCPACARGRLYKYSPSEFTRIIGHTPYSAERHVSEQLRCNGCGEIHRASLPPEVLADGEAGQAYGYSARAVMAIAKYFDGDPFFRQQTVQGLFGQSLSASTIYQQCERVADALNPVCRAMRREAAASAVFHIDDTTNRILDAVPLRKRRGNTTRMRSGVYTSVLLATVLDGENLARRVVLYRTNIGHAGEWLEEILAHRPAELEAPVVMSDALAANRAHEHEVRIAACNVHARRGFVEVASHYPEPARFALETYGRIWKNEGEVRERGLDPPQRLAYHRAHSGPAMEALRAWCEASLEDGSVEANGTLGQAMGYVLRHYEALTLFLRVPGAPIDNNEAERLLKLVVRSRKNSGFFKSGVGADVADVITSVLATCHENGINAFEYLCAVQRHAEAARREPERWLPWTYTTAAAAADASMAPAPQKTTATTLKTAEA